VSAATFERRLDQLATIPDEAIKATRLAVIALAEREGGTVTLGRKKRRVKLGAVARVKQTGPNEITCTVWGKPTGPWVWKTSGTSAHQIPKRGKPGPMFGRGFEHPIRYTVVHNKGIQRRGGAWDRVVDKAEQVVFDSFHEAIRRAVRGG
jgi:hypothetical protein